MMVHRLIEKMGLLGTLVLMSLTTTGLAETTAAKEKIDPIYLQTDVAALIRIHTPQDLLARRRALLEYLWPATGLPTDKQPQSVESDIKDDRYAALYKDNLRRIDRLTVAMNYDLHSIVYHFIPQNANRQLMIYHQGHDGDFIQGLATITAFVRRGYDVLALAMPLLNPNNQPIVYLERFGRLKLTRHDHLKFLDSPIKYFLEPVAVALNYIQKYRYDACHMIGLSGGGWTTTLYAALDTRIAHSYPVAGTLPIYLRSESDRDWGDFEQTLPELYRRANFLELYLLGGHGPHRKQYQILNKYDACCFAGIKYRSYENVVKQRLAELGPGGFDVFLDDSHQQHVISPLALKIIFADLEKYHPPRKNSFPVHPN